MRMNPLKISKSLITFSYFSIFYMFFILVHNVINKFFYFTRKYNFLMFFNAFYFSTSYILYFRIICHIKIRKLKKIFFNRLNTFNNITCFYLAMRLPIRKEEVIFFISISNTKVFLENVLMVF